jgi:hypothetical protein
MKQNIQQIAVQRVLQPIACTIKPGLLQFDIADTEEAIQQQMDDRAATYDQHRERESKRKYRLQSIVEDELEEPGQIDNMMSSSSASAVQPIVQAYEEQTTQNLRGALGPKGENKSVSSVCGIDRSTTGRSTTIRYLI